VKGWNEWCLKRDESGAFDQANHNVLIYCMNLEFAVSTDLNYFGLARILESGARSKQDPKIVQIQFQYGYKSEKVISARCLSVWLYCIFLILKYSFSIFKLFWYVNVKKQQYYFYLFLNKKYFRKHIISFIILNMLSTVFFSHLS
jgi:hypothetical protein